MAAKKSPRGKKAAGEKKKPAPAKKPGPVEKKRAAPGAKPLAPPPAVEADDVDLEPDLEALDDAAHDDVSTVEEESPVAAVPPVALSRRKPRPPPPLPPRRSDGTITLAVSPDADDAFMFHALLTGKVDTEGRRYEFVREEIQVLNERAREGLHDVTAISFAAYPFVHDRYLLLPCGASFGDGQGPILVARTPIRTSEVNGLTVAVPGLLTTAVLALRLWLPHARMTLLPVPFDEVVGAVRTGKARAGVVIHERQLTWREDQLHRIVDFGQWWSEHTEGLPLPLGANAIRRDIPEEERQRISLDIKRSIAYGLGHREETLDHAMQFAKGLERRLVERYVGMYVNELALDFAERGRQAVRHFFAEARRLHFLPEDAEPDFA